MSNQQIWLNRLYFHISNSKEKKCLTIDTQEVKDLGPGKFRTSAEDGHEQTCYFNKQKQQALLTLLGKHKTTRSFSIFKKKLKKKEIDKKLELKKFQVFQTTSDRNLKNL